MKTRILSLVLSLAVAVSLLGTVASATEAVGTGEIPTLEPAVATAQKGHGEQEALAVTYSKFQEPVDLSAEADNIMYFGDIEPYRPVVLSDEIEDICSNNIVFPDIKTQQVVGLDSFVTTFSSNQTFHTSGTISEDGGMFVVYPITLGTGCNIHAELVGPTNPSLNYILYLTTVDDSGSISEIIDACAYSKSSTGTTIPQTVATINTGADTQTYAIIVSAQTGYSSSEPFDVNITLGVGGDPAEPNDNAFSAYSIGTISVQNQSVTLSGTTLDSPLDVDWFSFYVSDTSDFKSIRISGSGVKYNLYHVTNGTEMVENIPDGDVYPLTAGMNYLRVTDVGNNYSNGDIEYTTKISVIFKAAQCKNSFTMSFGSNVYNDIPTQTYKVWSEDETSYWPEKRRALLGGCRLVWTATLYSASGYLCTDADNQLFIAVRNDTWSNPVMQLATAYSDPSKNTNGVATCTLERSVSCYGALGGVSGMSYDTNCYLTLSVIGGNSPTNGALPIFVTSRIMT